MSELIQWRMDWQKALDEAKKANRPLLWNFLWRGDPTVAGWSRDPPRPRRGSGPE